MLIPHTILDVEPNGCVWAEVALKERKTSIGLLHPPQKLVICLMRADPTPTSVKLSSRKSSYCLSAKRCTQSAVRHTAAKIARMRRIGMVLRSGQSALLGLAFLERPELAGTGIRLHLRNERIASATGREITFHLRVPFRLIPLGEPVCQHRSLLFGQLFDRTLDIGEVHAIC
jgi:hypothetical protein